MNLTASYTTLGHNSGQLFTSTSGQTYEGSKHTGPCFDYQRWLDRQCCGRWTLFWSHYHLSNTELESVNSCKELGVHVSRDLSWSSHVDAIVNKANKVVVLLKRTVGSKNREIFSMLYKSLVRPIREYACPVWSPCLVKDNLTIEKVQRRASRESLSVINYARCHKKNDVYC